MLTGCLQLVRCCRFFRCCVFTRSLLFLLAIVHPLLLTSQTLQTNDIIKFSLRDKYLILVQATVNGQGPFRFLLDTGSTHTVLEPSLASQLQLPVIGEASLTTVSDVRQDRLVRLKELRLGNSAAVSELGAIIDKIDQIKLTAPGVRGVLGEDFLSQFDILIDYKKHELRIDQGAPAGVPFYFIGGPTDIPHSAQNVICDDLRCSISDNP